VDSELQAIEKALQLERDGQAFYRRAAERTASDQGRQMFLSLADDEALHERLFVRQAEALRQRQGWQAIAEASSTAGWDQPLFPRDPSVLQKVVHPEAGDLDALLYGIQIEHKSFEYYGQQARAVSDPSGAQMYQWLAMVERGHFNQLMLNYESMVNAGHWAG
jgi:rubrerythrin